MAFPPPVPEKRLGKGLAVTYSRETLALIAAVEAGDCCVVCGGVGRCFDDCPQHPDDASKTYEGKGIELELDEIGPRPDAETSGESQGLTTQGVANDK